MAIKLHVHVHSQIGLELSGTECLASHWITTLKDALTGKVGDVEFALAIDGEGCIHLTFVNPPVEPSELRLMRVLLPPGFELHADDEDDKPDAPQSPHIEEPQDTEPPPMEM